MHTHNATPGLHAYLLVVLLYKESDLDISIYLLDDFYAHTASQLYLINITWHEHEQINI